MKEFLAQNSYCSFFFASLSDNQVSLQIVEFVSAEKDVNWCLKVVKILTELLVVEINANQMKEFWFQSLDLIFF